MIDLQDLRRRPEAYSEAAKAKHTRFDIAAFLLLDERRRGLVAQAEEMRAQKNTASKEIPTLSGAEKEERLSAMKTLSTTLKEVEEELKEVEQEWQMGVLRIPNIPLPQVPIGKDDSENQEVRRWGEVENVLQVNAADAKDHVTLGTSLDIIDIPRGVKVAGSRFYFLKGDGARLELAVLMFTLDHLVKKGFTAFIPPILANWEAMMGTSYFPGGEEQAYAVGVQPQRGEGVESDELYLIGTSEVSVASYHRDETLTLADLPKRYCGISPCFRREAGTYGKDTHGLYRIHQFQKVEQVILCEANPDTSMQLHREILQNAEEVLQALNLPYRVVDVCTGDMGHGQVYKNDIETWMPSRNGFGETHSCSSFYDFQARRLNIKYEDLDGSKKFVYTLNNTCIASPRILIPILEMYQQKDGSVVIPEVLRPYMQGQEMMEPKY